jgi:hypothetical protein
MLSTVTWSESGVVGIGERVAYYKADERVDALTSVTEGYVSIRCPTGHLLADYAKRRSPLCSQNRVP